MSDRSGGPGWWLASDGKWYPPQPDQLPTASGEPVATRTGATPLEAPIGTVSWSKRRVPLWALILTALVAFALGAAVASSDPEQEATATGATTGTDDEEREGAGDERAQTTTTERTTTTRPTTTTPAPYAPKPEDFAIAIVVTEQSCFGQAGCNIEYEIDVTYNGQPLEPGSEHLVTYEVRGGEDLKVASFEISSDGHYTYDSDFISTPPSPHLEAVATSVRPR